jgi:monoamine oxidase
MPRSSLLNALLRIAADVDRAQRPAGPVDWGPKIERRAALRGAASLVGMALLPRLPALAAAEARVAIVGAGLAGLTAAYELSKAGLGSDVYEGSTRLGGRCFSIRFPDEQIAERGGEFINTRDQDEIKNLAYELLGDDCYLDDSYHEETGNQCVTKGGKNKICDELWWFDGEDYSRDQATTDYKKLRPCILQQFHDIGGTFCCYKDSNAFARELDWMSLADWVEKYVCGGRASKLGQLIENALSEECAADSTALSGLVPAQQFWLNTEEKFKLYDVVSDEQWHLRGGNDQIPRLLGEKLKKPGIAVQTGTALAAVTCMPDGKVRLTLTRDSMVFDECYDRVILALPFSTLRQLDITRAGFRGLKRGAIEKLGMGASTKVQLRFKNRDAWYKVCCDGQIRLKSDLFQTTWDVTSAHRRDRGQFNGGMLCFWSGGSQAERAGALEPHELAKGCLAEAGKLLPGLADAWTGEMIRDAWRTNPWSLGSYAYLPIGYATTYFGIEKEPEGNCFFAGEHTADKAVECGYLNAAVKTGQRAAKEVLDSLTRSWTPSSNACNGSADLCDVIRRSSGRSPQTPPQTRSTPPDSSRRCKSK